MSTILNKMIAIDAIKPHERNYRNHPDPQIAQLQASHERFSQYRSVVLWARPNGEYITVAGHGIIEAMRRRGVTAVRADVLPPSTSQADVDAIMVADNNIALNAADDDALLAALLQEQHDAGYDLAALGSDEETLRQMLESLGDEYVANDDNPPDVQFKEFDESVADDLDTEMCQQCGKLCLKNGGKKNA